MTTDHMELRNLAHGAMASLAGDVRVDTLDLCELLAEFDMLKASSAKTTGYTPEFDAAWSEYPKRPGNSKAAAFKAWKASLKRGANVEQLIEGTRRYAAYCLAERTEPQYIKQASTFFGPGEHYDADWTVQRGSFTLAPSSRVPMHQQVADQRAANSAAAKARLLGHRPPPDDDGKTFEMGQP